MRSSLIVVGIAVATLVTPGIAETQSLDPTRYCPDTTTDIDKDGWGWENGRSCVVITSSRGSMVCPTTGAETDPDDDGWGWTTSGESCLVDNTSIDFDYIATNATGADVTSSGYPIVNSYVKSFGTFAFNFLVAADGTTYQFRTPDATLAATDPNGKTLWLQTTHNYMELLALSDDDKIIYAVAYDTEATLSSFDSSTGELLQKIINTDGVEDVLFGKEALIVVIDQNEGDSTNRLISLNYDGTVRWKLSNPTPLKAVTLGKDGKVYFKNQSGRYGNEITVVLEQ